MSAGEATRFVFDFGRVLFRWRPELLLRQVMPGRAVDDASARHWTDQVFQAYGGDWGEFDRGMLSPDALVQRIAARTGLTPPEVQAVLDAGPDELVPIAETVALVERLRRPGVSMHYLSNMPDPFAEQLERRHAVVRQFDSGLFSSRVRLCKPDPQLFALAAERFGAPPASLVLLDDHPANVDAVPLPAGAPSASSMRSSASANCAGTGSGRTEQRRGRCPAAQQRTPRRGSLNEIIWRCSKSDPGENPALRRPLRA